MPFWHYIVSSFGRGSLAGAGTESRKTMGIMDNIEYLVILMIKTENEDERFRLYLEGMVQKHPEVTGLTATFAGLTEEQKAA